MERRGQLTVLPPTTFINIRSAACTLTVTMYPYNMCKFATPATHYFR